MPHTSVSVFISYSHADAILVDPVVRLLRVNTSLVFVDTDHIRPGKRWRDEIGGALASSDLVVVFWCAHAAESDEVAQEWRSALTAGKDLLPLLLDATPLPAALHEYQWIDFRGMVGQHHGLSMRTAPLSSNVNPASATAPATARAPGSRSKWYVVAGLAAASMVLTVSWLSRDGTSATSSGGAASSVSDSTPTMPAAAAPMLGWDAIVPLVLLVIAALLFRLRRSRAPAPAPPPLTVEEQIASKLETAILARTRGGRDQ